MPDWLDFPMKLGYPVVNQSPKLGQQAEQAHGSSTRIHNVGVVRARNNYRKNRHDYVGRSLRLVLGCHHR